jgi:hypothetical protein
MNLNSNINKKVSTFMQLLQHVVSRVRFYKFLFHKHCTEDKPKSHSLTVSSHEECCIFCEMLKVHIEGHELVVREVKHYRTVAWIFVPMLNNFKILYMLWFRKTCQRENGK